MSLCFRSCGSRNTVKGTDGLVEVRSAITIDAPGVAIISDRLHVKLVHQHGFTVIVCGTHQSTAVIGNEGVAIASVPQLKPAIVRIEVSFLLVTRSIWVAATLSLDMKKPP